VHPDPLLRIATVEQMHQRWMTTTTPEVRHVLTAAMIREGQLELAHAELEQMEREGIFVQKWLFVLLLDALCHVHDFDAVLQLLYRFTDHRVSLPPRAYHRMLQAASQHHDYDLTTWIWQEYVEPMVVIPEASICRDVLRLAVNAAQPWLAESALSVLKSTDASIGEEDELLIEEAYAKAGKLEGQRHPRRGNLFSLFSKSNGFQSARFDPRTALATRRRP